MDIDIIGNPLVERDRTQEYESMLWGSRDNGPEQAHRWDKNALDVDTKRRTRVRKVSGWIMAIMGWSSLALNLLITLIIIILLIGAVNYRNEDDGGTEPYPQYEEEEDTDTYPDIDIDIPEKVVATVLTVVLAVIIIFVTIYLLISSAIYVVLIVAGTYFRKGKNRVFVAVVVVLLSPYLISHGLIGVLTSFTTSFHPGILIASFLTTALGGGFIYSLIYSWRTFS